MLGVFLGRRMLLFGRAVPSSRAWMAAGVAFLVAA